MNATPEILSLMAITAELRAAGHSRETVAAQFHPSPRTCRSWVQRHPREWRQYFDEAEERLLAEVGGEAYFSLRRLVRTGSERAQQDKAKYLYSRQREAKQRQQERET